jgi:drug/metabolite transporter (DMT)-like permease
MLVIAQTFSAAICGVILLASGKGLGEVSSILGLIAVNGSVTALAYALHYRALELGPIVVVSPIGASYAVVGVGLAVAILGERPGPLALAGAVVTVAGVMLSSTDLQKLRQGTHGRPPGLVWALGASVGFGVAAFTLGWAAQKIGWQQGLFASRISQMLFLIPFIVARRGGLQGVTAAGVSIALLVGVADMVGVVAFSAGSEAGYLSIVLAASAVFPAVAVGLSVAFLHERPVLNQYVGVAVVALGLMLLGLA